MCFSATASFLASGGLATAGVVSMGAAKKNERLLAAIPFLFSIQQFIEGLQWLTTHPSTACNVYGYGFLTFALLIWPTYVPIVAYQLERNAKRKEILKWFIVAGAAYTTFFGFIFWTSSLTVQMLPKGIFYDISVPSSLTLGSIYLVITCGSILLSTRSFFRWFGSALVASAFIAYAYTARTFVSVWCFFAAILSLSICIYLLRSEMTKLKKKVLP